MNVKGSALRSTMNFLREHYSADQVRRVLDRLAPEHRAAAERPILTASWYESELLYALMHAMAAQTPGEPAELFRTLGRQSCDDGLNTVYRVFFKVGTPSFMLKFTIQVWSNYYSEGKMVAVATDAKSAHLRLEGVRSPDEAMCERVAGWLQRALELAGAGDIRMEHSACVRRGGSACEWQGVWK